MRWHFRIPAQPRESGVLTATPIIAGDTVYVQDMLSNVYAVDRETGALRWSHRFGAGTPGPNGLALGYGRIFGSTDSVAFALDARTGRLVWQRRLVSRAETFVDIAPVAANGLVYTSTVGYTPGSRGALYALDAHTGAVRWRFDTILGQWRFPAEAGGGGAGIPRRGRRRPRVLRHGEPDALGGARRATRTAARFLGLRSTPTRCSSSTGGRAAALVRPGHSARRPRPRFRADADPCPRGRERRRRRSRQGWARIAWDWSTHQRLWETSVGVHRNDEGPLPQRRVSVCPGLLGGVETPMAYAGGRVFVPVIDLCSRGSATGYQDVATVDPTAGRGELVALDAASGRRLWRRLLPRNPCSRARPSPAPSSSRPPSTGRIYAFPTPPDGRTLWTVQARAPASTRAQQWLRDLLLVGAGAPRSDGRPATAELVAYGIGRLSDAWGATSASCGLRCSVEGGAGEIVTEQNLETAVQPNERFERATVTASRLLENIETVVHGKTERVKLVLAALTCRGHVLFEDVPGTAKTVLARSIGASIDGAMPSRIQCTPDLQPTDVTGLSVFNQQTREFEFRPGPVFANILLVDEINRAMPKTQSALLEAMAEHQVTVDGITRQLPEPFLLLATENPIEQEGTFPLPEAQLDRFFLKTELGYPSVDQEMQIVREQREHHPLDDLRPVVAVAEVRELQHAIEDVYTDDLILRWIVELVQASRELDRRRARRVRAREPRARANRARLGAPRRPRVRHARRRRDALPPRPRPPDRLHAGVPRGSAPPRS